ncbi:hypothetical protein UFOVP1106_19 [uncultured Caudovirales phage]|uniref:Uncharacterized protein n=1 Tax=uncultured Caudovirales phage TaxID=2100421 RepID=A0A6J5QQ38_9CAUD|nr:hypothetical protein UFOVP1106_19 [uncultured Caudovirales phage]
MTLQRNTVISLLYSNRQPIKMSDLSFKAKVSERALRLIIADIRENNLLDGYVLCSDDSGYYISNDSEVITQWLNRYLSYAYTMIKTSKAAKAFISEKDAKEIQLLLNF